MTFSTTKTFPEAVAKDKQFKEFFLNVGAKIRDIEIKSTRQNWNDKDHELSESLLKSKMAVRIALCDSFDTKEAVNELAKLVTATNTYIKQPDKNIKVPLLRQISRYIFQMLKTTRSNSPATKEWTAFYCLIVYGVDINKITI